MPDPQPPPESPRENLGARRLGRAGFIGVVGAGVATLFYGKAISRATSQVTNPLSDATGLTRLIPSSGWRIYTVADSMPTFDPATWRLRIDGLVRRPVELTPAQAQRLGVARAVVGAIAHAVPTLVVADGPTSRQECDGAALVVEALVDVAAAGSAVVVVTDDLDLAARCRTVVIDG